MTEVNKHIQTDVTILLWEKLKFDPIQNVELTESN